MNKVLKNSWALFLGMGFIMMAYGFFIFLFFFHSVIGFFGIYRMKVRQTVDNPDSQFVAMPQTITPAGIELNPQTLPIEEPSIVVKASNEENKN
ncbi:hypothetical protein OA433_00120 [Candidatus Pelagibacter sp.]|nr:hypothetical protein [Candidatus Pelagibacter sp.]